MAIVNGEENQAADAQNLLAFLKTKYTKTDNLAVELNGEIITSQQMKTTIIQPADHLEIIAFVGGG
ncbi:sulfur carrier protein ThiS [Pediococcus acidilactici]|uniref:sulfur carrier protein ThiS n=1 Tax=Pediococcus acidilactici TaxID=1254 RepID=UPI0019523714|nr:sulfur carrier protein ThiS [Pediococcus acidilactici]MBM6585044.1 sulfur carrier protein ThiS [Pediococcus acidilactici]